MKRFEGSPTPAGLEARRLPSPLQPHPGVTIFLASAAPPIHIVPSVPRSASWSCSGRVKPFPASAAATPSIPAASGLHDSSTCGDSCRQAVMTVTSSHCPCVGSSRSSSSANSGPSCETTMQPSTLRAAACALLEPVTTPAQSPVCDSHDCTISAQPWTGATAAWEASVQLPPSQTTPGVPTQACSSFWQAGNARAICNVSAPESAWRQ